MNRPDSPAPAAPDCSAGQRETANQLGMWTLIATEVLFFGGPFTAYFIYRHSYPAAFAAGSHRLEYWSGTVNTVVLLTSSLFLAVGDVMIKSGRRRALQCCLLATALLGALFLGIKFSEYYHMYREQLVPGINYRAEGPPQMQLFILLYFIMTGLHALHMLVGLGALTWLGWLNHRGRFSSTGHEPVVMVGLYWHFIDCVWVFLYPLLYLIPHLT
jgi:cytochrome c oxidase subunit 3